MKIKTKPLSRPTLNKNSRKRTKKMKGRKSKNLSKFLRTDEINSKINKNTLNPAEKGKTDLYQGT